MLNRLLIATILFALASCATRKQKSGFEEIADFGLSEDDSGMKVDDRAYFDDLKRSEASVAFESSLPLPLRVGKSVDPFDDPPPLAKPSVESRLSVHMGSCMFTLLSGPVQVDRYLLAGQWIKLTEGLPSKTPVKLEPNQDLNIKAVSKLGISLSESMVPLCRKMFEGRKIFLGRFHLNKSRIGFVTGPGSPDVTFGARSLDPRGKMVFLHWQSGASLPSLIDDFDFPATAESGIFRAQMANKGFYYLAFQTILRMDKVDSMVLKLPFKGSKGSASSSPKNASTPTKSQAPSTLIPVTDDSAPLSSPSTLPSTTGSSAKRTSVMSQPAKALVPTQAKGVKAAAGAGSLDKMPSTPANKKK
jgi:hypothetical protein